MNTRIPAYQQGPKPKRTTTYRNTSYVGDTIEKRVEKILHNGEPISDGAPIIYTERSEGVKPEHDIRTDRFDQALDMTEQIRANAIAKRKERQEKKKGEPAPKIEPPVPIPTTTPNKTE